MTDNLKLVLHLVSIQDVSKLEFNNLTVDSIAKNKIF